MSIQNTPPTIILQKSQFATRCFTSIFIFIALATIIYPQNAESLACAGGNNASVTDILNGSCGSSTNNSPPKPVAQPQHPWKSVYTIQGTLWGTVSTGSMLLAYGHTGGTWPYSGLVVTSHDGVIWTETLVPLISDFDAVAWGGIKFVALVTPSNSAVVTVMTSTDGLNWTQQNPTGIGTGYISRLVWTGSQFVALQSSKAVLTSSDGINWQQQATLPTSVRNIVWQGGKLFAFTGNLTTPDLFVSVDGINWSSVDIPFIGGYHKVHALTWTGSLYVAAADSGTFGSESIMTSPDGINWTESTFKSNNIVGLTWTGSQIIGYGDETISSPDGINWTTEYVQDTSSIYAPVILNNKLYTATSAGVSADAIVMSDFTPICIAPKDIYVANDPVLGGILATDPVINTFLTDAYANDVLDGSLVVNNDAPSLFGSGTSTKVTFTATNSAGKSSTATANVIVQASPSTNPADTSGSSSGGCFSPTPLTQQLFIILLLLGLRPITWLKNRKRLGNQERNKGTFKHVNDTPYN